MKLRDVIASKRKQSFSNSVGSCYNLYTFRVLVAKNVASIKHLALKGFDRAVRGQTFCSEYIFSTGSISNQSNIICLLFPSLLLAFGNYALRRMKKVFQNQSINGSIIFKLPNEINHVKMYNVAPNESNFSKL